MTNRLLGLKRTNWISPKTLRPVRSGFSDLPLHQASHLKALFLLGGWKARMSSNTPGLTGIAASADAV